MTLSKRYGFTGQVRNITEGHYSCDLVYIDETVPKGRYEILQRVVTLVILSRSMEWFHRAGTKYYRGSLLLTSRLDRWNGFTGQVRSVTVGVIVLNGPCLEWFHLMT